MSTTYWKLENDLCRCCHSEGSFQLLSASSITDEKEEMYSDMLRNVLDIDITPVEGPLVTSAYTICTNCIERLQDASNFKKQVLQCEQKFKDMISRDLYKAPAIETKIEVPVKEEKFDEVEVDLELLSHEYNMNYDISEEKDEEGDDNREETQAIEDTSVIEDTTAIEEANVKQENKRSLRARKTKQKDPSAKKAKKAKASPSNFAEKAAKGGMTPAKSTFRLLDEDYKKEGDMYQCTRCEKRYDKIFSLRFHVKTKHYKIPRFSCSYCGLKFMTPAPLTVHKLQAHNVDDRFACNACKGIFNTKIQLRKHINNFHMLGEKYTCEFCDYESFSFEGMYKHKFKHKTVKDYHCRFCRKSFLRKTTLDLHERIHTGDRRKVCLVCGQAFVQKASLNYHMTKYHPEVNF